MWDRYITTPPKTLTNIAVVIVTPAFAVAPNEESSPTAVQLLWINGRACLHPHRDENGTVRFCRRSPESYLSQRHTPSSTRNRLTTISQYPTIDMCAVTQAIVSASFQPYHEISLVPLEF